MDKQAANFIKEVGSEIKRRRELKGWDQKPFAIDVGTSATTLSAVELGKQATNLELIFKIAHKLECQPADLLKVSSARPLIRAAEPSPARSVDALRDILPILAALDDDGLRAMLKLALGLRPR